MRPADRGRRSSPVGAARLRLEGVCGIVGYVGHQNALEVTMDGLRRLEYRGYDSAGVAVVDERSAASPAQGRQAREPREGAGRRTIVRGPARSAWVTPAGRLTAARPTPTPTPTSTAPATSRVVHNGIIENFAQLRLDLERRGHTLPSETDTEVVAHLLEEQLRRRCRDHRRCAARRLPRARRSIHARRHGCERARNGRRCAAQLPAGGGSR